MVTALVSSSSATPAMRQALVRIEGTPVVFDALRANSADGIKFDVWYCTHHLPALTRAYAIGRLRRYAAPSHASYLAIGELGEDLRANADDTLSSVPAAVEHIERFIGHPLGTQRRRDVAETVIDSAVVYPACLRVPHDRIAEVSRWYEEEHLPMLLACPQWVMTRRFSVRSARGLDWNHVALHYMTDLRALKSPERDRARDTPWRDRFISEGWFSPEYRVYYRLHDF